MLWVGGLFFSCFSWLFFLFGCFVLCGVVVFLVVVGLVGFFLEDVFVFRWFGCLCLFVFCFLLWFVFCLLMFLFCLGFMLFGVLGVFCRVFFVGFFWVYDFFFVFVVVFRQFGVFWGWVGSACLVFGCLCWFCFGLCGCCGLLWFVSLLGRCCPGCVGAAFGAWGFVCVLFA